MKESAQSDTMMFDIHRTNRQVYLRETILFGIPNKLPTTKENKDDTMTTSLGAKIKRHRQEKGYSLDKLAELTDSSKSYIWELENRDARKPSGEKLTRIAQALEVTTDYLLDESEEPGDAVLKEAFFRKFSKLAPDDQAKITQMIDMWGKKD
ncbi:helix-turn-helix domain-containing protein [Ruegeria intermedia]|nr:helix-turn-helix transcriptional regulator [Ruegeria intermedia]